MIQIRNILTAWAILITAVVGVAQLPACASLSVASPQSTSEKVAYGYATLATVRTTAAQLLTSNTIKVADAKNVQALADQARIFLDGANSTLTSDPSTAQAKLQLATSILTQLQTFLSTYKGGK